MKVRRPALAFAAVVALFISAGCWVPQEQPILDQFFKYSRLRDRTALARFATVVFEPLDQGIVTDFTVIDRAPLRRDATGDIIAKELTLTAPVKLPNGQVEEKTLIVRMEKQPTGWKITAAVIGN